MVGLHAPEFETEKDPDNVRRQVRDLKLSYPIVIDNDLRMWEALGTQYWPTIYVIDRRGVIRFVHVGEMHAKTPEATQVENLLAKLLDEPA